MERPDGKHAITILLNKQDVEALKRIMEETYRSTMTDCIRAIIRESAKKFCPECYAQATTATPPRTKCAAAREG